MIRNTTVSVPAETHDLVTLEELKTDLGITGHDSDAWLALAITRASAMVAQHVGRTIAAETVVETFTPNTGDNRPTFDPLHLSRYPVLAVTSVVKGGVTLTADTAFSIDTGGGLLYLANPLAGYGWTSSPVVTVTYRGGYDPIPADLAGIVSRMVRTAYFSRDRDPTLRSSKVEGIGERAYFASGDLALGPAFAADLEPYRMPSVG